VGSVALGALLLAREESSERLAFDVFAAPAMDPLGRRAPGHHPPIDVEPVDGEVADRFDQLLEGRLPGCARHR
jgi:hypothetical protein